MKHWRALAGAVLLWAIEGRGQSPVLAHAQPGAARPGETTEVLFFGENLSGEAQLWTSFAAPAVPGSATNSAERDSGRQVFRVTLPRDARPGVGAVRVATTNGVSGLLLFAVDALASVSASRTNKSAAAAQALRLPVAVEGVIEELLSDYYKFNARRGERVNVEVVAQRLGSRLDPVVRLFDAQGRELAYSDDEPGLGADARLTWRCPATGEYVLELRDILYEGGARHRYRLRVGGAPWPARGVSPDGAETAEVEPNDTGATATRFAVPAVLSGNFARNQDRDFYQFEAAKNERLVFRAQTRSLGSPGEVFLQVQRTDGTKVAEASVNGADEGTLTNTFGDAGGYRLLVEELNRRGGPGFFYRVAVAPLRAGFELSVDTDRLEAAPGGSFELKVSCARREYDGPITLALGGAGDGFTLENAVIPEKKNEATLKARVPAGLAPGAMRRFRVTGRARIGDHEEIVTASTLPALRRQFPQTPYPPPELDGWLALGVKAPVGADSGKVR